jgi:hypothetical protein
MLNGNGPIPDWLPDNKLKAYILPCLFPEKRHLWLAGLLMSMVLIPRLAKMFLILPPLQESHAQFTPASTSLFWNAFAMQFSSEGQLPQEGGVGQ